VADELDVLLDQIDNPTLRSELQAQIAKLRSRRTFGLVFEDHLPERVRLPDHPIRRGTQVVHRDGPDTRVAEVTKVRKGVATLRVDDDTTESEASVDQLVAVAEFGQPIHPGLKRVGSIDRGGDTPSHIVINAENHHALEMLQFTHAGGVDCIYIDPPYNTGNEGWIYGDKYVSSEDGYKHSKWLAFMQRRLVLAKRLLAPTGVIIVAIGDDEHHRLRMLMDQELGTQNFIADVVWQGGRRSNTKYLSTGADYMLIYASDEGAMRDNGVRWVDRKRGVDEALRVVDRVWSESGRDHVEATRRFRVWLRGQKARLSDGVARYNSIDQTGRAYFAGDLRNPGVRPNLQYDLIHPITGSAVRRHPNGWAYSRETMDRLVSEGRILFGVDHSTTAYYKRFLDEQTSETPSSVFEQDRRAATGHLKAVLGDSRFPNPKDHTVLMRWIGIVAGGDAVILDFFAGSGSTVEAVMRLNAEDGGTRQCIAVTNNELSAHDARLLSKQGFRDGDPEWEALGVYEHVARPRIETIATGTRPDGSEFDETGLAQNIQFLQMTYLDPLAVELDTAFESVAPLLWMRAGGQGTMIEAQVDTEGNRLPFAVTNRYGVLFDPDDWRAFVEQLPTTAATVFVVTDSPSVFSGVAAALPLDVEAVRLYESYIQTFAINRAVG